jgi:hypothetical protein
MNGPGQASESGATSASTSKHLRKTGAGTVNQGKYRSFSEKLRAYEFRKNC